MRGQAKPWKGILCVSARQQAHLGSLVLDLPLREGKGPAPVYGETCMDGNDLPTFTDAIGGNGLRSLYRKDEEKTQTIDLNTLFLAEPPVSGSVDLRQVNHASFGKLLQALSVPTGTRESIG